MSISAQPALSIVVPAYNEEAVIEGSLSAIKSFLLQHDMLDTTELIVVTAMGTDNTIRLVADQAASFPWFQHVKPGPKKGKGRDVTAGMLAARGKVILFTDADLATPLHHIPKTLDLLADTDVVIGVRNLESIHQGVRYYLSNLSNVLIQLVMLPGFKDTQCGYKAFTAEANQVIFNRVTIDGWGFDIEVLKIARDHSMAIAQQPIDDWQDPKLEDSLGGDSAIHAAISTLKELWRIRVNAWQKKYQ